MIKNNRGFTLVEVLLTLTLLTGIGLLIWGVFFQGSKYTSTVVSANQMQQEANEIATYLTRLHQTSEWYEIKTNSKTVTIVSKYNSVENETKKVYESEQFNYDVKIVGPRKIYPNKNNVEATIVVAEKENQQNNMEIETYLYRLQNTTAKQEGE